MKLPLFTLVLLLTPWACGCDRSHEESSSAPPAPTPPLSQPKKVSAGASEKQDLRSFAQAAHAPDPSIQRFLHGGEQARLWSSFALGRHCPQMESAPVANKLVSALSSWIADTPPPSVQLLRTAGWALGRCGGAQYEQVFRPWLSAEAQAIAPELVAPAIYGLASLVDRGGRLDERTQTLLLDLAQREERADFLLPLSRHGRLSDAVGAHLLEVAGTFLTSSSNKGRRQAIFALASAGPSAAVPLAQVLLRPKYTPQERSAAIDALSDLGRAGQKQLDESLRILLSRGLPRAAHDPNWLPLIGTSMALLTAEKSEDELRKLGSLALPRGETRSQTAQRHRLITLRCRAADLLAPSDPNDAALLNCDPESGRLFALAQLRVLDRSKISGATKKLLDQHLAADDPVIAQAALRLWASHSELASDHSLLKKALSGKNPGTKTLAAQLIHAYPKRAAGGDDSPLRGELIKLLETLIRDQALPEETKAAALLAAGALGALNLKPLISEICAGQKALLWPSASTALSLLGAKNETCPPHPPAPAPQPASSPSTAPVVLVIDSDVGELRLTLDPQAAPKAVAHVLSNVDAGTYDHQKITFSRYGLTVQFGDEDGDGYENEPSPDIPFEITPQEFSAFSLGMSSFSPGAENKQLFVTVSDAPQLFGARLHLGQAEGPWELLVWGDELHAVKRLTK